MEKILWVSYVLQTYITSNRNNHQAEACNFIKKESLALVFSCEFCEISENTFFTEHLGATDSGELKRENMRNKKSICQYCMRLTYHNLFIISTPYSTFLRGDYVLTKHQRFQNTLRLDNEIIWTSKETHESSNYSIFQ